MPIMYITIILHQTTVDTTAMNMTMTDMSTYIVVALTVRMMMMTISQRVAGQGEGGIQTENAAEEGREKEIRMQTEASINQSRFGNSCTSSVPLQERCGGGEYVRVKSDWE